MKFHTPYSGSFNDPVLECTDPSRTQQQFKDEVDINHQLAKFKVTGQMVGSVVPPEYADYEHVMDFRSSLDALNHARRSFLQLPAEVRRRFGHDPQTFLEFCSSPDNLPEMRKMGLAVPLPAEPAVPAAGPVSATPPASS